MALGLTPYVRRRRFIWGQMALAHLAGGALGGLSLAAVLWSVGAPVRELLGSSATVVIIAALVVATVGDGLRLSTGTPRQVPPTWLGRHGRSEAFFLYGFYLGLALTTKVNNWLLYAVALVIALSESLVFAIALGVVFGTTRAAAVVLISVSATRLSLIWRRPGGPSSLRIIAALVSVVAASSLILPLVGRSPF